MRPHRPNPNRVSASFSLGLVGALALVACSGSGGASSTQRAGQTSTGFAGTALVSDRVGVIVRTTTTDANWSNPWALAIAPGLPFWVSDNNSSLVTLYSGAGAIQTATVSGTAEVGIAISACGAGVPANPAPEVYNGGEGFLIPTSADQESVLLIVDGEDGTVAAWANDSHATAVTAYDDGVANSANHAVYKGLALGTVTAATFLYATDLHDNRIDVFDTHFTKPAAMQGKFIDPTMPTEFVPFGIATLSDQLYVSYAKRDAAMHDETTGAGLGEVDVFDFSGNFVSRFASADALNAPWEMAVAPAGFGSLAADLLIGTFGDGKIDLFAPNGTELTTSMPSPY